MQGQQLSGTETYVYPSVTVTNFIGFIDIVFVYCSSKASHLFLGFHWMHLASCPKAYCIGDGCMGPQY